MAVTTYSYAQVSLGLAGYFDTLTDSNIWFTSNSVWSGSITGTDATLKVESYAGTPYDVYVDGVVTNPTISAGEITLFSGLSDVAHHVSIIMNVGYGASQWWNTSETQILTVTGAVPVFTALTTHIVSNPAFVGISTEPEVAAPGGNITPTYDQVQPATNARGCVIIRAQLDSIYLFSDHDDIWYTIDNGTPVNVNFGAPSALRRMTLVSSSFDDTAVHEYKIWGGDLSTFAISGISPVLADSPATLLEVTAKPTVYQYGDSITIGQGATPGEVDCWLYANENDYAMVQCGVGGQTTAQLTAALAAYTAEIGIPDHVVLAIGRNDVGSGTFETDYTACVDAFLTAGATSIICRGQLPGTLDSGSITTMNGIVSDVVTAETDPGVVFMNTAAWTVATTSDGTHPDAAGYVTINGDEAPALTLLISTAIAIAIFKRRRMM